MRRSMVCLLVALLGWTSSFGNESSYPRIVAKVHLRGQTAPIPRTTIWTPKESGLFRFSGVMVVTVPSNQAGSWCTTIDFTPRRKKASSQQWDCVNSQVAGFGVSSSALAVWDIAGAPLTYQVSVGSGNPQGSTYELFFTVERLQ
jgi:hypothetical protein